MGVGSQRTLDGLMQSIPIAEEHTVTFPADATALVGVVERAREAGVWPLVKMGDTGFCAVHAGRGRTCELNWANVKDFNPSAIGEQSESLRRTRERRWRMCKERLRMFRSLFGEAIYVADIVQQYLQSSTLAIHFWQVFSKT